MCCVHVLEDLRVYELWPHNTRESAKLSAWEKSEWNGMEWNECDGVYAYWTFRWIGSTEKREWENGVEQSRAETLKYYKDETARNEVMFSFDRTVHASKKNHTTHTHTHQIDWLANETYMWSNVIHVQNPFEQVWCLSAMALPVFSFLKFSLTHTHNNHKILSQWNEFIW